jgi:dUTP pyrophosphatase
MDLCASISKALIIRHGERVLIPTGIRVAVPPGYEMQIRPRSGLALKNGITVANSPGTVDSDYRGEVKVMLTNTSSYMFPVNPGDRIAQAVIAPVARATIEEVAELDETERGAGGFGSTGVAQTPSSQASETQILTFVPAEPAK